MNSTFFKLEIKDISQGHNFTMQEMPEWKMNQIKYQKNVGIKNKPVYMNVLYYKKYIIILLVMIIIILIYIDY